MRSLPSGVVAVGLLFGGVAAAEEGAVDRFGDPLPAGAVARLGTARFRHSHEVESVAFAPDGKTLVTSGYDRSLRVWDAATGRLVRADDDQPGRIFNAAFSPDGRLLATADDLGEVAVRSAATGEVRYRLPAVPRVAPAFSADGKSLAVYEPGKTVRVLDAATGKERAVVTPRAGPGDLALSPDGTRLAAAEHDDDTASSAVRVYDVATGRRLRTYDVKGAVFATVTFAPDGKRLAAGDAEGGVFAWGFDDEEPAFTTKAVEGVAVHVAFAVDGRALHVVGKSGAVARLDAATGKRLARFDPKEGDEEPKHLALSRDGQFLALVRDDCLTVRDLAAGRDNPPADERRVLDRTAAWSPDGKLVAVRDADGGLLFWSPTGAAPPRRFAVEGGTTVASFSPDGRRVASFGEGVVRISDAATGDEVRTFEAKGKYVALLGFAPAGRTLAVHVEDEILLIDAETGTARGALRDAHTVAAGACFTADGRTFAAGDGSEAAIRLWEVATGKSRGRVRLEARASSFAVAPDGATVAVADQAGGLRVYHAGTGRVVARFAARSLGYYGLAFSPGGTLLAAATPDGAQVWDLKAGTLARLLDGHDRHVLAVAFSPDGRQLLTVGQDRTALVWDVAKALAAPAVPPADRPRGVAEAWADLGAADGYRSFAALTLLADRPDEALPLLRDRLRPAVAPEAATLAKLVADLDSDRFETRDQARKDLVALDRLAEAALRKALAGKPTPEAKRLAEEALAELGGVTPHPDRLREVRAVEALERIGTPTALKVLEALSVGAPAARLTDEASQAAARLKRRLDAVH